MVKLTIQLKHRVERKESKGRLKSGKGKELPALLSMIPQ